MVIVDNGNIFNLDQLDLKCLFRLIIYHSKLKRNNRITKKVKRLIIIHGDIKANNVLNILKSLLINK